MSGTLRAINRRWQYPGLGTFTFLASGLPHFYYPNRFL
jgi:hypothetical protein